MKVKLNIKGFLCELPSSLKKFCGSLLSFIGLIATMMKLPIDVQVVMLMVVFSYIVWIIPWVSF